MTSLAVAAGAPALRRPPALRPPRLPAGAGRRLAQPEALSVGLIAVLAVVGVARGPLTRFIGTADDIRPAGAVSLQPPLADQAITGSVTGAQPPATVPPPRHVPHDPFAARVAASGALLGVVTPHGRQQPVAAGPRRASGRQAQPVRQSVRTTPASAGLSCPAGRRYVVRPGDSLWTIAAARFPHAAPSRLAVQWRRIYRANTARIGPTPSLLAVGTPLCLPG